MFLHFVVPCFVLFRNVLFATPRFLARNQRISIKMAKGILFALLIFASHPTLPLSLSLSLSLSFSLSFNFLHVGRCSMKNSMAALTIYVLFTRNNLMESHLLVVNVWFCVFMQYIFLLAFVPLSLLFGIEKYASQPLTNMESFEILE